ncbi:hypothetical protein ACQPXT_13400 [Streptomyces sp. CA-100214]
MGDLWIALIAAGAALAGSALTGWFTARAGRRQAVAAERAGEKQAEAVILTVTQTLDEQRIARAQDVRRAAYANFLMTAEHAYTERQAESESQCERFLPSQDYRAALASVQIEGPREVERVAVILFMSLRDERWAAGFPLARANFICAARRALGTDADPSQDASL